MNLRGASAVALAAILLSSCGSNAAKSASESSSSFQGVVPLNCNTTKILSALQPLVKGASFIDTQWKPAPGTDLEAILKNGGIACTYGDQPNEIGVTVSWARGVELFNSRKSGWLSQGFVAEKLSDPDISESYFLGQAQDATHEFHRWEVNFLYGDIWIQVQSSMGVSISDNAEVIQAALASVKQ